ncbi:MAG: cysteate synthase, partial [Spirochaetes bacterium]
MKHIDNNYTLKCPVCGTEYYDTDKGFLLSCSNNHRSALLRAQYDRKLTIRAELPGIFRYSSWLPVRRVFERAEGPAVYRSIGLGDILGLKNLYVAFNGYWPEKNVFMDTCSFKELEAPGVLGRLSGTERRTLVVSSAGNTGRAFLKAGWGNGIAALIVEPERALPSPWVTE